MSGPLPWIGGAALVIAGLLLLRTVASKNHVANHAERPSTASGTASGERRATPTVPSSSSSPSLTGRAPRPVAPPQTGSDQESPPPTSADERGPLVDVQRAMADPSSDGTNRLVASLSSGDAVVVAEASKALIARRATSAIRSLTEIDLSAAAGGGLSIIDALGRLGALADPREKGAAVDRLIALLADEKRRDARESASNLLQIYEALGETRDPRAAKALEAELLDPEVGRAPKVVIVQALVSIGGSDRRAALAGARAQQAEVVGADAFEEEVRQELVAAIDKALAGL